MEHVYGHCCTSPRLREPSGTFMDPKMDPKIDPARLILEDPCRLKALQGPSKVQIDKIFFIDLETKYKLKNKLGLNWAKPSENVLGNKPYLKVWSKFSLQCCLDTLTSKTFPNGTWPDGFKLSGCYHLSQHTLYTSLMHQSTRLTKLPLISQPTSSPNAHIPMVRTEVGIMATSVQFCWTSPLELAIST